MPNHPQIHGCPVSHSGKRGGVLVTVLGIVLLLSILITRFMEETLQDLEYRALFNEPHDVRSFAFSMLEVTLATIHEVALIDDGKLYAPEQGWADPLSYAQIEPPNDWQVQITVSDQNGKFPLNSLPQNRELLIKLLEEALEFDYGVTRELVSTLIDWIDKDNTRLLNGAESEDYLDNDPPYRAANSPLQTLDELRLLKIWEDEFFDSDGRPNERFRQLEGMVSVQSSGPINLNAASKELIEVLSLEQDWQADYLFDGLEEPYLKQVPAGAGSAVTNLLRIDISVQRAEVPYAISALVSPAFEQNKSGPGAGSPPPREAPITGTISEQSGIRYPFKILQINEYRNGRPPPVAARYSAVDIER